MSLMYMSFLNEKKMKKKDKRFIKTLTKIPTGVMMVSQQNFEILFKNNTIRVILEDN